MSVARRPKHHYSFDEYLALCEESTVRLEYWDGQIYAMAGGSLEHSRLSLRVGSLLDQRRPSGCTALESNTRIRPLESDRATYADAVLVCGDYEVHPADSSGRTLANPSIVGEVLSDSTAEDDETDKFDHYALAPSLNEYVLVWQNEPRVEVRTRSDDGAGAPQRHHGRPEHDEPARPRRGGHEMKPAHDEERLHGRSVG